MSILKWQLTPSYLVPYYISQFSQLNASLLHLWNNAISFKGMFTKLFFKKKNEQFLTGFAKNKTSDAYFCEDGWTEIKSLLY